MSVYAIIDEFGSIQGEVFYNKEDAEAFAELCSGTVTTLKVQGQNESLRVDNEEEIQAWLDNLTVETPAITLAIPKIDSYDIKIFHEEGEWGIYLDTFPGRTINVDGIKQICKDSPLALKFIEVLS